jgi:hypothetical protein
MKDEKGLDALTSGHGFSRAVTDLNSMRLQPLRDEPHDINPKNSRPVFLPNQGRNSTVRDILPARPLQVA